MYRVGTTNKHIDGSRLWLKVLEGRLPALMVTTDVMEARVFDTLKEAERYVMPGYSIYKV